MVYGGNMLKIMIVEDERIVAEQLKSFIEKYAKSNQLETVIVLYQNPEEFLKEYQNEAELIFMDINMPQMNGMNVAKKLRKLDAKVNLVFVTYLAKYAINGYEVHALDFILKPVSYENFAMKMDRILSLMEEDSDKKIMVKTTEGVAALYVKEIRYVEIAEHYLYFHMRDDVVKSRGTLKEVQEILDGEPFASCNKCYLVNLERVDAIVENCVIVGHQELQISRLKKKEFMKRLAEYYANRKINMGKLQ